MIDNNKDLKRKAFYLTAGTNILFFLMLMIIVAWKETYPPPEEYGIELGTDNIDISDVNNELEDENEFEGEDIPNADVEVEEEIEENETTTELTEESKLVTSDSKPSDVINEQNLDPVSEKESPMDVDTDPEVENGDKNELLDTTLIKEKKPSTKIIDERAIFKSNASSSSGSKGSSLDMQGWVWDFEPNPVDNSRESGKIVFEIVVDYYGEIIGLRTLETTLSPAIENIYREEILKLTFSPTNNDNPSELSKGKITFLIRNN
tara:strand:- start:8806 stop:9594 length:789 start_codon:yes stop_codon:yes gene_type:complete